MNELIKINYDGERQTISARALWEFLDKPWGEFMKWFNQFKDYGFIENQDFRLLRVKIRSNNPKNPEQEVTDYEIAIDMAKELCMLQKTEKGKQARQYFIELEKKWNSPEAIMSRALAIANKTILALQTENNEMKPKAEYFDQLVDRNGLTNFRDTAKELGVKESDFINLLERHKYIYRDTRKRIKPIADYVPELFQLKEFTSKNNGYTSNQTMITLKGRDKFRILVKEYLVCNK